MWKLQFFRRKSPAKSNFLSLNLYKFPRLDASYKWKVVVLYGCSAPGTPRTRTALIPVASTTRRPGLDACENHHGRCSIQLVSFCPVTGCFFGFLLTKHLGFLSIFDIYGHEKTWRNRWWTLFGIHDFQSHLSFPENHLAEINASWSIVDEWLPYASVVAIVDQ